MNRIQGMICPGGALYRSNGQTDQQGDVTLVTLRMSAWPVALLPRSHDPLTRLVATQSVAGARCGDGAGDGGRGVCGV